MKFRIQTLLLAVVVLIAVTPVTTFAQETNLGDILVRFCNDESTIAKGGTKAVQGEAIAGEPYEICLLLSNTAQEDVTIGINFVDGTITADEEQRKACQPEGTAEQFGQYVEIDQREFEVAAGKTLQTYANVTFPLGYAGMSYGCVTSQLLNIEDQQDPNSMFQIVSRRANFIDLFVNGEIDLGLDIIAFQEDAFKKNLSKTEELAVYYDEVDSEYYLSIHLENPGTVAQDISLSTTLTDIAGKSTVFTVDQIKILPQGSVAQRIAVTDAIQWYQGPMSVETLIQHTPTFEFESDAITDEMRATQTRTLDTSFLLFPWMILGGVGVLILALLLFMSPATPQETHNKED